jgi:2-(1,2-epoxy-1,2-dihydrophenyl)acetyl-CoA isomerase
MKRFRPVRPASTSRSWSSTARPTITSTGRVVGPQRALEMLYTGVRLHGEQAHAIGLCDRLVSTDRLREAAVELAEEIAVSSPLAIRAIRQTMRGDLANSIREATTHEAAEQDELFATSDFREGVSAAAERRLPRFTGS